MSDESQADPDTSPLGAAQARGDIHSIAFYRSAAEPPPPASAGLVAAAFDAVAPVVSPSLEDYAKRLRKAIETAGVTVGGIAIETDETSQTKILGAALAASRDPAWSTAWASSDGHSYLVNAVQMLAIADAVQAHINAAFRIYADVRAGLTADPPTLTTQAEIAAAFNAA